jgi:hypothetical protein
MGQLRSNALANNKAQIPGLVLMGRSTTGKNDSIVVSASTARANFGNLLKLAAPEPEVLRIIGEKSKRNGTNKLTPRQINQLIKEYRAEKKRR